MNFLATSSIIESDVNIGEGTRIWYFSHVCESSKIGKNCNIGDQCYIGRGVIIGNDTKVGNNVSIYSGVVVQARGFVGNGTSFTHVRKPMATRKAKRLLDTIIEDDVSIGANATIVCGIRIGEGAVVADGAVVLHDVNEKEFVAGNPARVKKILEA